MKSITVGINEYKPIPNIKILSTEEKGRIGEEIARSFLQEHGFFIEEWFGTLDNTSPYDCLAKHDGEVFYIEVRTSFTKNYKPRLSKKKRERLDDLHKEGANVWLLKIHYYEENPRIVFESFSEFLTRSSKGITH